MKIVLRADVEHVGQKGDIVDVADGYARNFLVPRGLALRATSGIQKQADAMRRSRDARDRHAREAAQAIADQLAPTIRIEAPRGRGWPALRFGHVVRHRRRGARPARCRSRPSGHRARRAPQGARYLRAGCSPAP